MAPSNVCSVCHQPLFKKDNLTCSQCKSIYDIDCAKVPHKRFMIMEPRQKSVWKCSNCNSKLNKPEKTSPPKTPESLMEQSMSLDEDSSNITQRAKLTQCPPLSPPCYVTEDSLREILKEEISSLINSNIKQLLTTELKSINDKISEYQESMSFLSKEYDDIKSRINETSTTITELRKENDTLKAAVGDLTGRLNTVELHMRECNLEINGIPENRSENLIDTLVQMSKIIDNPIRSGDINQVTRVAKLSRDNDRPRAIVVKLLNPRMRDEILAAVTKFNKKNHQDKLNTSHLGIGGTRAPVYVAEHLTPANKYLHAAARKKAKDTNFKFVWVRNGRVYVRKDETHQAITIRSMESLNLMQ